MIKKKKKQNILYITNNSASNSKELFIKNENLFNSYSNQSKIINPPHTRTQKKLKNDNLSEISLAKTFSKLIKRLSSKRFLYNNFSNSSLINHNSYNINKLDNKDNINRESFSQSNKGIKNNFTPIYRNINNQFNSQESLFQIRKKKKNLTSGILIHRKISYNSSIKRDKNNNTILSCYDKSEKIENKNHKKLVSSNSCYFGNKINNSFEKNKILGNIINKIKINNLNNNINNKDFNIIKRNIDNKSLLYGMINSTKMYSNKRNYKTNNNIDKYKRIIYKNNCIKLYSSRKLSSHYIDNINKKLFTDKIKSINNRNKYISSNTSQIKGKISKSKFNENHSYKKIKNIEINNNINNSNCIDKKIRVNLNLKNNKIRNSYKKNYDKKVDISTNSNFIIYSGSKENSKSFISEINTNIKELYNNKKIKRNKNINYIYNKNNNSSLPDTLSFKNSYNSKSSNDSSNKFIFNKNNNNNNNNNKINNNIFTYNLYDISKEPSELNNILFNLMNKKLQQFNDNNNNFFLNEKSDLFLYPDGPEDFHLMFVELYKQNNMFYKKLENKFKGKTLYNNKIKINLNNNINDNYYIQELEEYFENGEDEVPYI